MEVSIYFHENVHLTYVEVTQRPCKLPPTSMEVTFTSMEEILLPLKFLWKLFPSTSTEVKINFHGSFHGIPWKLVYFHLLTWNQYRNEMVDRAQRTGWANKWNLSCYNPRVLVFLFGFRLFVHGGGGSTAAVVTLDTAVDESRKKTVDSVTRSPARLRSRDEKLCYYVTVGVLSMIFFFVLCFLLVVSSPSLSRYVYLLGVAWSVQGPSATLQQVRVLLVIFASCYISEFRFFNCLVFLAVIISWRVRCALVPDTLALDLPTLIDIRFLAFICFTVTTELVSLG